MKILHIGNMIGGVGIYIMSGRKILIAKSFTIS